MSPINRDPHTGMNAAVADTLRAERAVKRLTLDELAAKSGIPKRTLIRLLDAERSLNIEHLVSLADALELSLPILMERAKARIEHGH